MKADLKAKWIKALRSGRYKQGKAELHPTEDTYCCLGVLCKVARIEKSRWEGCGGLWDSLNSELGVSCARESRLTKMNDSDGWSFKQIADWLEKH